MIHVEMPENASSMVTLNLSNKNLCSFNDIKKFKNLIELDLSENNFKFPIPNLPNLKYLKRLNLAYNQLSEFWSFPESLEILVLNSNLISSFNDSLGHFKHLTTLDLSYNMLCDVSILSEIVTLKYLFLKNNHIIKTSPLLKLVGLCELDLESNEISDLHDLKSWELHTSIAVLNIKGNPAVNNLGHNFEGLFENLTFEKDCVFAKSSKFMKNSMMLFNNNKRNLTNKSVINKSLMQNKQENNSSFSETITSEEDPPDSSKNLNQKEDEEFHNENTNFFDTKNSSDQFFKGKSLTPTNDVKVDPQPALKKIKKLFLNTSAGNIQNFCPIKIMQNNTNTSHNQAFSLDQNISFLNSMATQINQTSLEGLHPAIANTTNSPIIFNKTVEKFKTLLTNNEKKISEKYQNKDGFLIKKHQKKNFSALFGKEDKEQEETSYKQTTEALIKKNHQLQIENYNLRRSIDLDKMALNMMIKKLYDVIKTHLDKSLSPKNTFEMNDLDSIIEIIETNLTQGFNFEMKHKILHQFDNLRDYYRKKMESLTMRINELESQIAFQIKPIIQTQQQTIEFYKSRIQSLNLHHEIKGNESNHSRISNSKHSRTRSLNCSKLNKNHDLLSHTDKIKISQMDFNEISLSNQEKMRKYVNLLKNTIMNLTCEVQVYNSKQFLKEKENSNKKKMKKH